MLTKKYALHYWSAFIEVRSDGTIGAYAITTYRYNEFHSQKSAKSTPQDKPCKMQAKLLQEIANEMVKADNKRSIETKSKGRKK